MTDEKFSKRVDTAARLAELRSGTAPRAADPVPEDPDETDEAFSVISADRRQKVMLELRFKTGNAKALAYSYLVAIDFDPSKDIRLDFSGADVRLSGRNLEPLFSALVAQRVAVVTETDDLHAEALLPGDATVVTLIEVRGRE